MGTSHITHRLQGWPFIDCPNLLLIYLNIVGADNKNQRQSVNYKSLLHVDVQLVLTHHR